MRFEGGRQLLLGLDIIRTTCIVQSTRGGNGIVDGEKGKTSAEGGYKLLQRQSTDAIGAIYNQGR